MKTISVVIPTMWRSPRLVEMIKKYQECDAIFQIILIDNSNEFWDKELTLDKIKLITPVKNIYVNPAWNEGVNHASGNIVCVLNDDISPDVRVFQWIRETLTEGIIIGSGKDNFNNQELTFNPSIEKTPHHTYGWGTFFAMHKKDWVTIPPQLKVFYGDTWFFEFVNKECKVFTGVPIDADMNQTVTTVPEVNELHKQEIVEWKKLKEIYPNKLYNWYE